MKTLSVLRHRPSMRMRTSASRSKLKACDVNGCPGPPTAHRDVRHVGAPQLIGPVDRQLAQQIRIDPVLRVRINGVFFQVVRDWGVRFNERGPDGLIDGKAPGTKSLLSAEQRLALLRHRRGQADPCFGWHAERCGPDFRTSAVNSEGHFGCRFQSNHRHRLG